MGSLQLVFWFISISWDRNGPDDTFYIKSQSDAVSEDTTTSFPRTAIPYIRTSPFNPWKYSRSRICRIVARDSSSTFSSSVFGLDLFNYMMM